MYANKKCTAGKYCAGGLTALSEATNCSKAHYCPEGEDKGKFEFISSIMIHHYQNNVTDLMHAFIVTYSGASRGFMELGANSQNGAVNDVTMKLLLGILTERQAKSWGPCK